MLITDKRKKVRFEYLGNGDVFVDGETPHIKVSELEIASGLVVNAVDLKSGVLSTFDNNGFVETREAELILK